MTMPISNTSRVLRKRFGMFLKIHREDLGMTQAEVGARLDYSGAAMVSQQERGVTVLPPHYLPQWANILGIRPRKFAKHYLYYCEPDIYRCMYGEDPYVLEEVPRPAPTLYSAPGRRAART